MNEFFMLGIQEAMEKIAKSGLHPRAIAGFMQEGGKISKSLAGKFRMSPGELNKARKIQRKASRKAAHAAELTRRKTQSSFFSNMPATRISNPSAARAATKISPTAATKINQPRRTGAAEALGL